MNTVEKMKIIHEASFDKRFFKLFIDGERKDLKILKYTIEINCDSQTWLVALYLHSGLSEDKTFLLTDIEQYEVHKLEIVQP